MQCYANEHPIMSTTVYFISANKFSFIIPTGPLNSMFQNTVFKRTSTQVFVFVLSLQACACKCGCAVWGASLCYWAEALQLSLLCVYSQSSRTDRDYYHLWLSWELQQKERKKEEKGCGIGEELSRGRWKRRT